MTMGLLLLLLALPAGAAEVPFTLRQMEGPRDVGSVNENFRAISDAARRAQNDVDALDTVDNTWTGVNTFNNAVFNSSISINGGVFGTINASTKTVATANAATASANLGPCLANISTITLTTQAIPVDLIFSGAVLNSGSGGLTNVSVLIDGQFPSGFTASRGMAQSVQPAGGGGGYDHIGFTYRTATLSAAAHNFCVTMSETVGDSTMDCVNSSCWLEARETR